MFQWQAANTVVVLFFASYAALYALLLVWAGLSRVPYGWRYGAVLLWLAVWSLAEMEDVGLFSLFQAAMVLPALAFARWRRTVRPETENARWRFGIRDLLWATLLCGGVIAIAQRTPTRLPGHLVIVCAGMYAALTLASAWLALGTRWLWLRCIVFALASGGIWYEWRYNAYYRGTLQKPLFSIYGWMEDVPATLITTVLVFGVAAIPIAVCTLVRIANSQQRKNWAALGAASIILAAPFFLCGWHYYYLTMTVTPPVTSYPEHNSYDAIRDLAQRWKTVQVPYEEVNGIDVCRTFANEHRAELMAVRSALRQPGKVRLTYGEGQLTKQMDLNLRNVRRGLQLLAIDAPAEERVALGLDLLRFAQVTSEGGLYTDYLVAHPYYVDATRMIALAARELDTVESKALIAQVAEFELEGESLDEIANRDWVFCILDGGWIERTNLAGDRLTGSKATQDSQDLLSECRLRSRTWVRMLQADLAIQAYRKTTEIWPKELATLVPEYLPSVPVDPFGDGPLQYRVNGDSYVLYSVGHNRQDDQGVRAQQNNRETFGDLVLEPPPSVETPSP